MPAYMYIIERTYCILLSTHTQEQSFGLQSLALEVGGNVPNL